MTRGVELLDTGGGAVFTYRVDRRRWRWTDRRLLGYLLADVDAPGLGWEPDTTHFRRLPDHTVELTNVLQLPVAPAYPQYPYPQYRSYF